MSCRGVVRWGVSCRGGVGHVGVGWVMQGCGCGFHEPPTPPRVGSVMKLTG